MCQDVPKFPFHLRVRIITAVSEAYVDYITFSFMKFRNNIFLSMIPCPECNVTSGVLGLCNFPE